MELNEYNSIPTSSPKRQNKNPETGYEDRLPSGHEDLVYLHDHNIT